jgi:hypothetical protein
MDGKKGIESMTYGNSLITRKKTISTRTDMDKNIDFYTSYKSK